jgi:acyl-CoA reductase-like NAD-dependent aldehyde dehydrogenase
MLRVVNPATEEAIAELEEDTLSSIELKVKRARLAQQDWSRVALEEKIRCFEAFRALLLAEKEALAATLTSEMGKPITQSLNEINAAPGRIDFFVANAAGVLAEETVLLDRAQRIEERISHEPLGTLASISAWNYPYFVGLNIIVPALLTGNAVLYKPSEFASLTGIALARLLHQAGIPQNVLISVIGGGAVGQELLNQPLSGIFFTGSYLTGREIAKKVAPRLLKLQLELGGKDPVYICDDVNVEAAAAATADGAFYNAGQSCCAIERLYIHERVFESFVKAFLAVVGGFVLGDPMDPLTYLGPLARRAQLDVLENQVKDAVAKGAKLVRGGRRVDRRGYYFAPTVLTGVDHSMLVMREESFGPIIGLQAVENDDEALALMNDTEYGLTAGVYSTSPERAKRILARAEAGSVYWNCCDRVSPRLPWTGRGHSGSGCTLSRYGIQAFLRPKAWHLRSSEPGT